MIANHKQTYFVGIAIYMLKCSALFQLVETTNICKIGFKSFAHIHVHENLGEKVGEKQTNIKNIAKDIIPFQQCSITYSRGGFDPKV